jgi:hypothetical protein
MVDPRQTHVRSIWRTPSGRVLYEKNNFGQPLFDPPHAYTTTSVDVKPSGQPIDHPINQMINPTTTFRQVKSEIGVVLPSHLQSTLMVTPTILLQAIDSYTPQNLVGTPSHQRMKNPSTKKNPTARKIPIGGQPQFNGQIPTRGKPLFGTQILTGGELLFTIQIPVSTQTMAGGQFQPSFIGNPSQTWGPSH